MNEARMSPELRELCRRTLSASAVTVAGLSQFIGLSAVSAPLLAEHYEPERVAAFVRGSRMMIIGLVEICQALQMEPPAEIVIQGSRHITALNLVSARLEQEGL